MTMAVEHFPPIMHKVGAVMTPKSSTFRVKRPKPGAGGARRALSDLGNNNAQFNIRMAHSHLAISQEIFSKKWNFDPVKEVPLPALRYDWTHSDKKIVPIPEGVVKDLLPLTLPSLPASVTSRVPDLHKANQEVTESGCTVQDTTFKQGSCANDAKPEAKGTKEVISPRCDTLFDSTKSRESECNVQNNTTKQESCANEVKTEKEATKEVTSPTCDSLLVSTKIVSSKTQKCITDFLRPQKRMSSCLYDDCQPSIPPSKKLRTLH
ncbi:unnamed protein product [Meganyctiphanes norvegica]|uniref:Cyclin-dependent kinase inhibitor domain-containing protein n=1 Tax=Meganyctiphanes norvegica TaxID=48144 RepID=A0AAV2S487_MEGNR